MPRRKGMKSIKDIRAQKQRIITMARARGAFRNGTLSKDASTAQNHVNKARIIASRYEKNINQKFYGVDEPLEWGEDLDAEQYVKTLNRKVAKTIYAAKATGGQG